MWFDTSNKRKGESINQKIRRFGYQIHSRPKDGEPIWKLVIRDKDGVTVLYFPESEVLCRIADKARGKK